MDELRRGFLRENKLSILELWECQGKQHLRKNDEIESLLRSTFPFNRASTLQKLLSNMLSGEIFGYV